MKNKLLDQIESGEPKHTSLPQAHIARIKHFKEVLREVDTTPLTKTVNNFCYDKHPARELEIWEAIAEAYENIVDKWKINDLSIKKKIFKLLLTCSSGKQLTDMDFFRVRMNPVAGKQLEKEYHDIKQRFSTLYFRDEGNVS